MRHLPTLHFTSLRKFLLILLLALLSASLPRTVSAGPIFWKRLGFEGGSISALAIDPKTPTTLYAGALGGVFVVTISDNYTIH
jgi:hypothetical protein